MATSCLYACADATFVDLTARALGIHIIVFNEHGGMHHYPENSEHRLQFLARGTPRTVVLSAYVCNPDTDAGHYEAVGLEHGKYPACTRFSIPEMWSFQFEVARQLEDEKVGN
jgi:hypothetical protein